METSNVSEFPGTLLVGTMIGSFLNLVRRAATACLSFSVVAPPSGTCFIEKDYGVFLLYSFKIRLLNSLALKYAACS